MFERNSRAEEVFSAAWEQVQAGRSIESVLDDYPEQRAELEPMLRTSLALRNTPRPILSPAALGRINARAQAAAEERRRATPILAGRPAEPIPDRQAGTQSSLVPTRRPWFAALAPTWRGAAGLALL